MTSPHTCRITRKSIWTKNGQVIAPRTKIDVVPSQEDGWRIAYLVDEPSRGTMRISESDLQIHTEPSVT
jgi:hypothetical protein